MKKKFIPALAFSLIALATSCGSDDDGTPIIPVDPTPSFTISENITEDTTLTNDQVWTLDGRVAVVDGVTLTIEPGTIIKGEGGTGANASVLIIAQGATINAQGTGSEPIIFTSIADDILAGQTAGTNLDQNQRGLWGGLLILGKAPISVNGDSETAQIEGIPASDANGLYGGTDAADNSGVLRYVSIRHGGALIGEGNEINGLTLGGVGSGTEISFIEVVANVDDGIEFFGGTVNASNLFVWACGDDHFDIDQAYSGTINNAMSVHGSATDHALEIDGPEGSLQGKFTLQNVTLLSDPAFGGEIADYRSNAQGVTNNVLVAGFPAASDVELDNAGVATNFTNGNLSFDAWEVVLPEGISASNAIFVDKSETIADFTDQAASWTSTAADIASAGVGADTSAFAWTFSNQLAGLGF